MTAEPVGTQGSSELLEAIWDDRLPSTKNPRYRQTCVAIGVAAGAEVHQAIDHLDDRGIGAVPVGDPTAPSQRRAAAIGVDSPGDGLAAAEVLAELGYRSWDPIDAAAGEVHRRLRSNLTLARTTDATMVLDVEWPAPSGLFGRLPAALVPNENDYDMVALPTTLWPLYVLLRPLRLLVERLGRSRRTAHRLGPFLGTPQSLIAPLLNLAGADSDDVVADLGCGDGRVVLEAASSLGCRAIGVESNPRLVAEAKSRMESAGEPGELVTVLHADATEVGRYVNDATVFFVFVPADAAVELITTLLATARPGSRIVAHEQHRLLNEPPGAVTTALVTDDAITVGYCWTVS